jgi:hypothetical protein
MELRQIVNAATENAAPAAPDDVFSQRITSPAPISPDDFSSRISSPSPISADTFSPRSSSQSLKLSTSTVQGTCLYIGPAGQRCNRAAGASGFCSKHQLNPSGEVSKSAAIKRAAAISGVLAALWPFIADLIREILRHFRWLL